MNDINHNPIEENAIQDSETVKEFLDGTDFPEEKEEENEEEKKDEENNEENSDEEVKEDEKPSSDTTSEEKPEKEVVLEQKQEDKVPLEDIVSEVKEKAKEETKQEILKALGMTEKEKEVIEEKGYKFPWEERGEESPKDWKEVIDASIKYQEFKKQEQDKALTEKQKQELGVMQEREAQINTEWDGQLDYLRSENLIPEIAPEIQKKLSEGKILTKAEREDDGLKAQAEIFEKMYEVSLEREKQGLPPITDVIHIYSRYIKPKKPAGATAPVSGGNTPISQSDDDITYDELHKAQSFEELL